MFPASESSDSAIFVFALEVPVPREIISRPSPQNEINECEYWMNCTIELNEYQPIKLKEFWSMNWLKRDE